MSEKPHYHGHRERLRARLARDPRALADYEVVELLLGLVLRRQDTKPLAKDLLARFGTVRGVLTADAARLREVDGFGPALEALWTLLGETRARFDEAALTRRAVLDSPQAVAAMAMSRLDNRSEEEFWVALVDNANRLTGWERLSRGTVDQTEVYPREIFRLALERKAAAVVLVHNHPGGAATPSQADKELTWRVQRAGRDMGISVLDHVIVAEGEHYSFKTNGLM
ncbi:MAG: DNA repair protein RadC [Desulfovibrionaceae bacterium]|jgi:DNA repair protein RadC|nr:DNA repair protein RadC [Desulfovibrionaceae bacterium]